MKEKTYIITRDNGTRSRITVPEDWKVTFGPAARGNHRSSGSNNMKVPMALRFYESEKKQRAIFTDIVSFRDASIKMEDEKVRTEEKDGYTECEGVRKRTTFRATVKEWVDPDEEDSAVPLLPTDKEIFSVQKEEF